jgi:hypothetical protein
LKKSKLRKFLSSIKEKTIPKIKKFFQEEVDVEALKSLKKILLFVGLLILALIALEFNKSISYKKYERIQFNSAGATLYANLYYPSKTLSFQEKRPLIIYCHGMGSKRDFDLRIPIEFTKRGFYLAALDYQGHGESGGNINNIDTSTNRPALAQDCTKLLEKLKTLSFFSDVNESQIGLIGHSLGGMVVLMNQALNPDFKCTVAWAPLVNFTPPRYGLEWQGYEQYIPVNLLNSTNSENLLIIMHVNDEALDFKQNAVKAQELTNCTLINITKPLIGGGHQLFTYEVLVDSINWFEMNFFNSEEINGSIMLSYFWNYVLIFLNLGLLIAIIFLLISYTSRFFQLKKNSNHLPNEKEEYRFSKKNIIIKSVKILLYSSIFILNWQFFASVFGLIGIFYASLLFGASFLMFKLLIYLIRLKKQEIKFERKLLRDLLKREFEIRGIVYSMICTLYFIIIYLIFTYYYPFAFIWPSSIVSMIISINFFPIYFSIELLFRIIIYPQLNFVKSEKSKVKLLMIYAFIIYGILMSFAQNFSYLPSILFTFFILLILALMNNIIYEHTKHFSAVLISSFIIIQIFFSAFISNLIGLGRISRLF